MFFAFLLIASIAITVSIYIYLQYNPIPNNISYKRIGIFIFSIFIVNGFIILYYLSGEFSNAPIDTKKIEHTAIGMKHYKVLPKEKQELYEFYTGLYKVGDKYKEFEIPKGTYNYFLNLWGGKEKEMTITLDSINCLYFIEWNKEPEDALVYTEIDLFTNYFKNVLELYNFYKVSESTARKENLFTRSRVDIINSSSILEPRQSLIHGIPVKDGIDRRLSNISSLDSDFRPVLLIWVGSKTDCRTIVNHQRSYISGGKNNEVIFCININNLQEKKIVWSGSFSWALTKEFENYVLKNSLKPGKILDLEEYGDDLISGYSKNLWHPRNFENYSILRLPLTDFTILIGSIFTIILNIIMIIVKLKRRKNKVRD